MMANTVNQYFSEYIVSKTFVYEAILQSDSYRESVRSTLVLSPELHCHGLISFFKK